MANLSRKEQFGETGERIEVDAALAALKLTRYGLAKLCEVEKPTAYRWRKYIPKAHHDKIPKSVPRS